MKSNTRQGGGRESKNVNGEDIQQNNTEKSVPGDQEFSLSVHECEYDITKYKQQNMGKTRKK